MKEYSIDFEDLLIKYDVFLKYAVNNGSYMSFITFQEKPYSKIPPNCRHDKMTEPLLKFLSKQEVGNGFVFILSCLRTALQLCKGKYGS